MEEKQLLAASSELLDSALQYWYMKLSIPVLKGK